MLAGGHVHLTDNFTDLDDYLMNVPYDMWGLLEHLYLLESDANAIVGRAIQSDIGNEFVAVCDRTAAMASVIGDRKICGHQVRRGKEIPSRAVCISL